MFCFFVFDSFQLTTPEAVTGKRKWGKSVVGTKDMAWMGLYVENCMIR